MANSSVNFKNHARSVSLPSTAHSLLPQSDEILGRLQASESASTSSNLSQKLSGLCDLYDCVGSMLLLPFNQQVLAKESQEKWVGELLEGSLRLLDVCGTIKDALLQTRQHTRDLQSVLRRRRGEEFVLSSEFGAYLVHRKQMKKLNRKALKNLKYMENKSTNNKEIQQVAVVSLLKDVEQVSLTMFESLLSFIAGQKTNTASKQSNWTLVMKLMQSKSGLSDGALEKTQFEKVDAALSGLLVHKTGKSTKMYIESLQKGLGELESSIQELEEGLECLYRHLVKTRVSFLNILTH